jgi:RNA polymerase sigma-70 factor (ECF subfamily)
MDVSDGIAETTILTGRSVDIPSNAPFQKAEAGNPIPAERVSPGDWRRTYGQAYALTRNSADAEDAVQETYLRLFQADARGGRIESTTAWMRSVLRNVVFQRFHKERPDLHVPLDMKPANAEDGESLMDILPESTVSIEDQIVDASVVSHSLKVLSTLSAKEQECVLMYAQGLSFVQISQRLDISYKVALTTTKKALVKVRERIAG